jgi:hypothetical protein
MNRIFVLAFIFALQISSLSASAAEKEWTFLLYLNGNNNLDSYGSLNINQMEKVGSSSDVNLVVQWASLDAGVTKRLYVEKDNDTSKVTSPVVQDLGKADMGSATVLEDFIRWGVSTYPAKHYFVAVWDHGSGWHARQARAHGGFQISDISWDDNTGHSITTKQLGQVMNNVASWMGRKIDIYGSDACLMGMVEIAGEMKDSVSYFLGSQDLEPGEGWPYTEIFAPLIANPHMSARDFTALATNEYTKSYSPGGSNGSSSVTMSSFDMSKYAAMQAALATFGSEVLRMPASAKTTIFTAAKAAQAFEYSDYVDLGDFLKKIKAQGIRDLDPKVIQDTSDALNSFVLLSRNTGSSFAGATGASIWIPKSTSTLNSYLAKYKALQFESDTHWSDALNGFVGK